MNTAQKGNAKEVRTAALLQEQGWTVASRRHIGGAGDLLAIKPGERPRLIEVKARKNVWEGFRREDRVELLAAAKRAGAVAEVAWWKPRAREPVWLDEVEWPGALRRVA